MLHCNFFFCFISEIPKPIQNQIPLLCVNFFRSISVITDIFLESNVPEEILLKYENFTGVKNINTILSF